MIGIVISGLVMLSFYNAFEFINEEIKVYSGQQDALIDVLHLQIMLNKDFMQSDKVLNNGERSIELERENDHIHYRFEPAYVLRVSKTRQDTFSLGITDMQVKENNYNWVESIRLKALLEKQEIFLFFKKEYTARHLMNEEKENQWP